MDNITVALCIGNHDRNLTVLKNGRLLNILQEDRFSRIKYDKGSFLTFLKTLSKFPKIKDFIFFNTTEQSQEFVANFLEKHNINVEKFHDSDQIEHHLYHACSSFYKSDFEEAGCLSIDGWGGIDYLENKNPIYRTCSIYKASLPNKFEEKYNRWVYNPKVDNITKTDFSSLNDIDSSLDIGMVYDSLTMYLGFHLLETGKSMGLSSYGKPNPKLPEILYKNTLYPNSDLFLGDRVISLNKNPILKTPSDNIKKDFAYAVQEAFNKILLDRVIKTMDLCSTYNVSLSGGCSLNVIGNYYVKKKLPKLNLFVDPIGGDSGLSYGVAKHFYSERYGNIDNDVYMSNYNGLVYSNKSILKVIKSNKDKFNITPTSSQEVAKLISKKNIVAIFQGPSESGPRALGNRSILYDPRDPNGKNFVNQVKKREEFRPFAGTILLNKAHEWFDMANIDESPYMSYAMDVLPDKQKFIPCITHVDGTCRIQTVTKNQNYNYYKLVEEFEKITGVPILFNTSFNLAGDPLVETIEDALKTLLKSKLKYLYLPELKTLLEKK